MAESYERLRAQFDALRTAEQVDAFTLIVATGVCPKCWAGVEIVEGPGSRGYVIHIMPGCDCNAGIDIPQALPATPPTAAPPETP